MLNEPKLREAFLLPSLSRSDRILLCLAVDVDSPKHIRHVKELAINSGLLEIKKWNVSTYLAKVPEYAVRIQDGWVLSIKGKAYVNDIAKDLITTTKVQLADELGGYLHQISDPEISKFVEEAIVCYENGLFRASVVLSWIGAMAILYDNVIQNRILDFNFEAQRRDTKWKLAKTKDDLARMKESDFLDILETLSIIGKSVKLELRNCLQLRNGCGHPNSLQIGENMVASHIENLILNVFSKFV